MLVDTEIGVVTNDRILLAFCILHGLNVFFTSAMDVARLIYFKNKNDLPAGPVLDQRSAQLYTSAQELPAIPDITSVIQDAINQIVSQTDLTKYILQLKNFMSNVGRLRSEFDTLTKQYNDNKQKYETTTGVQRFNAANAMVSSLAKIQLDIEYNTKTITELKAGLYPGSPRDKIRIDALEKKLASGARITKSVEIVEAKEILLSIRDDLKQTVANGIPGLNVLIRTNFIPSNPRGQGNYDEILSVMPTLSILVPGPQQGGGHVDAVYDLIRKRSIRVLPNDSQEFTSTVNIYKQGSQYIDEKLNAYTVSDEYIVTEDDLKVIESIFTHSAVTDPSKASYVTVKYLLLVCDIQLNELFTLIGQSEPLTKGEDSGNFEAGTIQSETLRSIWNRALQLEQVIGGANVETVYTQRLDTPLPQNPNDIEAKLNAIRTRLIEHFPLDTNLQEVQETINLQSIASSKYTETVKHAGIYREAITQQLLLPLGILRGNQVNEQESNELGSLIETALQGGILDIVNSDEVSPYNGALVSQGAESVVEKVVEAVALWASVRRPGMNVYNILQSVRTYAKEIRRMELGQQGGRRPLYSERKVGRRTLYP
jgi:hypothetical protein